jgi:hypothetical protein
MYGANLTKASTIIIQGQLTNSTNNIGIANHAVNVSDSVNYYDTFMTTANGYYYIVITGVTPSSGLSYYISTRDCNNILHYGVAHSTVNITTVNFSICDTTPINCQNSFTVTHQNLLYNFSGSDVNTYPTLYFWSFGDGFTASGQNTSHSYPQPVSGIATYTVILNTKTILPNFDTCYAQSSLIINVSGNNPIISGNVSAGGSNPDSVYVYLYGINNPIGSCVLIDTTSIDTSGFYYFNSFTVNYPAYILKAKLTDNNALNSLYIPSYYDSLYSWVNSPPVYPVTNNVQYNIYLIPIISTPSGTGSISGNISEMSPKLSGLSVTSGVEILLLNLNNKPIRVTYTDNSGHYSFTNLPFDNYKVFVEITGKMSVPASLTLNISMPTANNINFVVKGNSIALAVDDETNLSNLISEIYPNPLQHDAYIDFSLTKSENLKLRIYNQLGEILQDYYLEIQAGNQQHLLKTQALKEGIYTLQIISNKSCISKKFIKIK